MPQPPTYIVLICPLLQSLHRSDWSGSWFQLVLGGISLLLWFLHFLSIPEFIHLIFDLHSQPFQCHRELGSLWCSSLHTELLTLGSKLLEFVLLGSNVCQDFLPQERQVLCGCMQKNKRCLSIFRFVLRTTEKQHNSTHVVDLRLQQKIKQNSKSSITSY